MPRLATLQFIGKATWQENSRIERVIGWALQGVSLLLTGLSVWKGGEFILPWWGWLLVTLFSFMATMVWALARKAMALEDAARPPAPAPDPPDIVAAKNEVANYFHTHVVPAQVALREAVRLSAYAFMAAWDDSPAGKLGWSGILSSSRSPELIPALASPDTLRPATLDGIQEAVLRGIVEYRRDVHKLQEVVSGMAEHDRLRDKSGFFQAVREWRPLHDAVVEGFRELRKSAHFPKLGEADIKTYLTDPRFDLGVLAPILERNHR